MLRRKLYRKLLDWKRQSAGSTALFVEGARRVGKSYLVELFGRTEYRSMLLIDFSQAPREIRDIFENETYDLDLLFAKLSAFYGVALYPRESLVVFDEVQLCPSARQLIKHLVADGRYDYVETGSLVTLRVHTEGILIPSEEERICLYPLDFEEFLWALGDDRSMSFVRACFESETPLGQAVHRKLLNVFRQYLLVGGMPKVVSDYVESKDFHQADRTKRTILSLYREDVAKFAGKEAGRVRAIFDQIPAQLSQHDKKFVLASLEKSARSRSYEDAFMWLAEAMVINPCYKALDPSVGLALNADHARLKCYLNDTGLLVSQVFDESEESDEDLYRALLFDKLGINEGMFIENAVAQMLVASGHDLYFYAKDDRSCAENRMEVDFLVRRGKTVSPIEVKSSTSRRHSSLDKFKKKFGRRVGQSYVACPKDIERVGDVLYLPFYMVPFI